MGIAQKTLDTIKAGSISKVVESLGAKLKRVGREYVTQCIWHDDTNPSLTINDDKGFCFCHVCREGGDAVSYVRRRKGLGFQDGVELAAQILGIEVQYDGIDPEEQARRREARKKLIESKERTDLQYRRNLYDSRADRIRQILKDRGLNRDAAVEFGLGFAPDGPFAGRITIPIYNHSSELVGWTGRATKSKELQPAKYKNSAEDELFQKKMLVFNEPRAREAARLAGSLIFVEGHLDVVSLWLHGVANVVAMQGTGAPDPLVIQRLTRNIRNVILCFDGDEGGKKAVQQFITVAGPMAANGDISIQVVKLPEGMDPDEVIRERGVDAFHAMLHDADPWLDWLIDEWATGLDHNDGAMITEVERRMRSLIDGLHSNALRAHYIDKAARVLAKDSKDAAHISKTWGNRTTTLRAAEWRPREAKQARIATSRRALRIYIHRPELREQIAPLLDSIDHPPLAWLVCRLRELEQFSSKDLTPHSIMAVVAVSEPHFLQQLRTIIQPKVTIDVSPGVLAHCADILCSVPAPDSL